MRATRRWVWPTSALGLGLVGLLLVSCSSDTAATLSASERTSHTSSALDSSPTLSTFALYGERSVRLGNQDQVRGGDVGVAAAAVTGFGAQLIVGPQVQISKTNNLLAPSVTLGSQSQVGDVQATTLVNNGAQSLGTVAAYPASLMPVLPVASNPASSTSDVTVAAQAHVSLSPGAYGSLTVGNQAYVTLAAGTYSFSSVSLGNEVQILGNTAGVTWLVGGPFATGSEDQINRSGGATAGDFTILVAGSDASGGTPLAASIGSQTQLTGLLAAPHGTLSVASQAQLTGAFAAFDIGLGRQVQVTYEDGFSTSMSGQGGTQQLSGYITPQMAAAPLVGPVAGDTVIQLAVGLPLRNEAGLLAEIAEVYDPTSPKYHQYLSPSTFAADWGPLPPVTVPLLSFLAANGLTVTNSYTSNQLYDVAGPASAINSAFFVNLNYYERADGTVFYALDREPSLNLDPTQVSVGWIDGLENFLVAVPLAGSGPVPSVPSQVEHPTGVNMFMGSDFRNAYVSGVTLAGEGQTVALVELDSYVDSDITKYESCPDCSPAPSNWLPSVLPDLIPVDGLPVPPPASLTNEATLDVDMILALAPNIYHIYVYEAPTVPPTVAAYTKEINDILVTIANPQSEPLSNQVSCSWVRYGSYNTLRAMYQFARQGQSFFQGSGDNGSYNDNGALQPMTGPESNYMTLVGGTRLTTAGGKAWASETTWNDSFPLPLRGDTGAGGGGSMNASNGSVPIPFYQLPIASQINSAGGEASWRAVPDVAMTATDIGIYYNGSLTFTGGTSAATPLWAAFAALVNEEASYQGEQPLGFANPALYAAAESGLYTVLFNDIVEGTNSEVGSGKYAAGARYDLATGWGTPTGNLVGFLGCPTYCGNSGDACVDLDTDPANCGVCGNSCGTGGSCVAGQCGQVTVGMTAGASGLEFCVVGVGFIPGDFVNVTFAGTPTGSSGKSGVVDAMGEWAYFGEVSYDTSCNYDQASGTDTFTINESDPDQSVAYSTEVLPTSYFCGTQDGGAPSLPDIGPGASSNNCVSPDGLSNGLFFGD